MVRYSGFSWRTVKLGSLRRSVTSTAEVNILLAPYNCVQLISCDRSDVKQSVLYSDWPASWPKFLGNAELTVKCHLLHLRTFLDESFYRDRLKSVQIEIVFATVRKGLGEK